METNVEDSKQEVIDGPSFLTKEVLNLYHSAGVDETRSHLIGIHISVENSEAVVTDGHKMVICDIDLGRHFKRLDRSFTISSQCAKSFLKALKGYDYAGSLTVDLLKGKIELRTADETLSFNLLDGSFPSYRAVMPKKNKLDARYCINPNIIDNVRKSFGIKPRETSGFIFTFKIDPNTKTVDPLAPCIITSNVSDYSNLKAVVMPMRLK